MSLDDDLVRYTVSWVREGGELEYINHFKLAPLKYPLKYDLVLEKALQECKEGLYLVSCTDHDGDVRGKIFRVKEKPAPAFGIIPFDGND